MNLRCRFIYGVLRQQRTLSRQGSDPVAYTTNTVIRDLAGRVKALNAEMRAIDPAVRKEAPDELVLVEVRSDHRQGHYPFTTSPTDG